MAIPSIASLLFLLLLLLLLLLNLSTTQGAAGISYEYGYTVSTVLDANKLEAPSPLNPFSLVPLPGKGELLLLDSSNSALYTVSLPVSQESKINRFAGGEGGFSDGETNSAKFDHPRSFAVDSRGNIYVADKNNRAIRKISSSGVTTVAGGYSTKPGHADGPGQNASFSNDFDLTYVPKMCALLISDHGTRLIRQVDLKPEDCFLKAPHFELGLAVASIIGILCLLLGLVAGFTVRPLIISHDFPMAHHFSKMWRHYPTQVENQILIFFYGIRSVVASSGPYLYLVRFFELALPSLCLMFRYYIVESRGLQTETISLLDLDASNMVSTGKPHIIADQLKDLISCERGVCVGVGKKSNMLEDENGVAHNDHQDKIDEMIRATIKAFDNLSSNETFIKSSGLTRRK